MSADIPFADRPQNSVGNGVQQHIGIGMPQQSLLIRDIHPPHDQLSIRHQTVYVVAVPDAHGLSFCLKISGHQLYYRLSGRFVLMQDLVGLLHNRHLDPQA